MFKFRGNSSYQSDKVFYHFDNDLFYGYIDVYKRGNKKIFKTSMSLVTTWVSEFVEIYIMIILI